MAQFNWDDFEEVPPSAPAPLPADEANRAPASFDWNQFQSVEDSGEPGLLEQGIEQGKEFGNKVVDELPMIGGMTGSFMGMRAGPVGQMVGAGVGAYTGHAVKNAIHAFSDPEKAPKSDIEYITEPLESGAGAVIGEGLGYGIGKIAAPIVEPVIGTAMKYGKMGVDKLGSVSDTVLKKIGKVFADVPEEYTSEYLKRGGKINARPEAEIFDEIQTLYNKGEISIKEANRRIEEARYKLTQAKDSVNSRKQQLHDQFQDQRYSSSVNTQTEREKFSKAATATKETLQSKNVVGLRNRVVDAIERLKEKVTLDSTESYVILSNQKGTVSVRPLLSELEKGIQELKLRGKVLTGTDEKAIQELISLRDRLKEVGSVIRFPEAKFILQRLGKDTDWPQNAGAFTEVANAVKKRARAVLDQDVKNQVPAYRQIMLTVDENTRLLSELSKKFGSPELALSRLNNITSTRGRHVDFELLKRLGNTTKENFEKPIQDLIKTKDVLGSPSALRALEEGLPEFKTYQAAVGEQKRLAMPETRRQIRERILQSKEHGDLTLSAQQLKDKQASLLKAEEEFKPLVPFGLGSVQAKARALTGARNYAPKKLFADLDKATGKNFTQEVKDRAILDSFEKGSTQGSRKTLMGALLGKSINAGIGGMLGHESTGTSTGTTLGALAGFSADKYAGLVLKSLLNRRINATQATQYLSSKLGPFTEAIVKAAERGPEALGVVGSILGSSPEFQKILKDDELEQE